MNRCSKSLVLNSLSRYYSQPMRLFDASNNNNNNSRVFSSMTQKSFREANVNCEKLSSLQKDRIKSICLKTYRNYQYAYQNSRNLSKTFNKDSKSVKVEPKKEMKSKKVLDVNLLFRPIKIMPVMAAEESNAGEELSGRLNKNSINQLFARFKEDSTIQNLATEKGLSPRMFGEAVLSFRRFCIDSKSLDTDLHIVLFDISNNSGNLTDLFPYFYKHATKIYPHLNCMDDLKELSDLSEPANWYPKARELKRTIIYHAGPTNSGKTYSALKAFQSSKSGVYCGPLKLLASEVFTKTNQVDTKCDLITGEERRFADASGTPSEHMACTVEMANLDKHYQVAVIDEIQMINDLQRGWAWTRAFLGLVADEIHVCGDKTALDLITDLTFLTGDTLQVREYKRLTELNFMNKAVETFENVEKGDCFVCFNKNDIFTLNKTLEKMGHEVAVIYGAMPPAIKLAQAKKFNDPNHKCKILVATDAIGMGLNLNIRRVIFYSLRKPQMVDNGEKVESQVDFVTTSQALQIAGRAGRFNTAFADGFVTTFHKNDLKVLLDILKQPMERTTKAGLHPTAEQIELFAYQLPNHSLSELLKIFTAICKIDNSQYFLCNFDTIRLLAEAIDHIPIPLRAKYTFATSPISNKNSFVFSNFVKFVRAYSNNEVVSVADLKAIIEWPLNPPKTLNDLNHLESVYDLLDLYLWLGVRFQNIFAERDECVQLRVELENVIYKGVQKLLNFNDATSSKGKMLSQTKSEASKLNNSQSNQIKIGATNNSEKETSKVLKKDETKSPKVSHKTSQKESDSPPQPASSSSSSSSAAAKETTVTVNNPKKLKQALQSLIKNKNIQNNFADRITTQKK